MTRKRTLAAVIVLAGFAVWFASASLAGQTQGPIHPPPGTPVQQAPPKEEIRVRVALVNTPVTVRDSQGNLVLNLRQGDFHVYDNGVEQKISSFDLGGEPISAVLVFETSSRVAPLLPAVQKSAILFTQVVLGPSGEAAVLGYDDRIERLLPFTSNHDRIEKTITHLQTGNSGARLYDAISAGVGLLRNRPAPRRRVLIVVGESVDTGSEEKLGAVLREAQLANITIYTVGLSTTEAELRAAPEQTGPVTANPPGTFGMPPVPGTPQTPTTEAQRQGNINILALAEWIVLHATAPLKDHPLEVAAVATGGMNRNTLHDSSIQPAIDAIGSELHAQYTLSYRPTGVNVVGYHRIKLTVDQPGLTVRTRPGYFQETKN